MKLNPWDVAAGALMVKEAGGSITNFQGDSFSIYGDELVASNGLLHDRLLEVLKEGT
jgi:myo-inositol-1(or 4)-monophosphatase